MSINLIKGQRENLQAPKFTVGLGWDTNTSDSGAAFDLDASAFILGNNRKLLSDNHFVFYNNLQAPNDSVIHSGDNLDGEGDGEQITVDLSKIDPNATEIYLVITIHEAETRRQNFGQVRNSFIRIFNSDTKEELLKYELEEDFSIETAVEFARIYKKNDEWKFEAIGVGKKSDLQEYLNKFN